MFAALSGDFNPMHIDPIYARRLMFGKPVVHGIHLVLCVLEQALSPGQSIQKLKVSFNSPILINKQASFEIQKDGDDVRATVKSDEGSVAAIIKLSLVPENTARPNITDLIYEQSSPKLCEPEDIEGASGKIELVLGKQLLTKMFPALSVNENIYDQIAILLASTKLVGMECPGLHSIYKELKIDFIQHDHSSSPALLEWQVSSYNARYNMIDLEFSAIGNNGKITTLVRPAPSEQPSYQEVCKKIENETRADVTALIIGGSRGLGELTAKILAASGAKVLISYCTGKDDATKVATEINEAGGRAYPIQLDIMKIDEKTLKSRIPDGWSPTDLYYFATPHISGAGKGKFSDDIYSDMKNYYLTGFKKAVDAVYSISGNRILRIFYPSTVFVSETPDGMAEYAKAKEEGEILCQHMAKNNKNLHIKIVRLPKMATDQTATLMPVNYPNATDTLIEAIA